MLLVLLHRLVCSYLAFCLQLPGSSQRRQQLPLRLLRSCGPVANGAQEQVVLQRVHACVPELLQDKQSYWHQKEHALASMRTILCPLFDC